MLTKYVHFVNGRRTYPTYNNDLGLESTRESRQIFFRTDMSGSLTFIKDDYEWLKSQSFETEFVYELKKSIDDGATYSLYFTGVFYKTDWTVDETDKKITTKVKSKDDYDLIMSQLDKEFDLLKLAPIKTRLAITKRPLIQLYVPGENTISCFLSGNSWEQEVLNPETDTNVLFNTYQFRKASSMQKCLVQNIDASTPIEGEFVNEFVFDFFIPCEWYSRDGIYKVRFQATEGPPGEYAMSMVRRSDDVTLYQGVYFYQPSNPSTINPIGSDLILYPHPGSGTSGTLTIYCSTIEIWMRYLLDVESVLGLNTTPIPTDDLVANNRNYRYVIGYNVDSCSITNLVSANPTQWGRTDDGNYFIPPTAFDKYYPVAKSHWGLSSIWYSFNSFDWSLEEQARKTYILRDGILISEAITVLLKEIDPSLTHEGNSNYSEFLYGITNPISGNFYRLMITPKSNLLGGDYDQPAQKAIITLKDIFDMLKDCFQCYWFIDAFKRLRIEHIEFFRKGRSYSGTPTISVDLTTLLYKKNNKTWDFLNPSYSYDKIDLPEFYTFKWMDDVTNTFIGYPIEIQSRFITKGKKEEINISKFTTDIDYILLNPDVINKDGFGLFAATYDSGLDAYNLPFVPFTYEGADLELQNGFMSWLYLHPQYWVYDLPSYNVKINGVLADVQGIIKKKRQKVNFPYPQKIDNFSLIKTQIGLGEIEKVFINLRSENQEINLMYDTE